MKNESLNPQADPIIRTVPVPGPIPRKDPDLGRSRFRCWVQFQGKTDPRRSAGPMARPMSAVVPIEGQGQFRRAYGNDRVSTKWRDREFTAECRGRSNRRRRPSPDKGLTRRGESIPGRTRSQAKARFQRGANSTCNLPCLTNRLLTE